MRGSKQDNGRMIFQITPRHRRDGFTLNSATLIFPLWYTTLNGAVSYARFLGREHGCDIRICNATGSVLEEIKVEGSWVANKAAFEAKPVKRRARRLGLVLNKAL